MALDLGSLIGQLGGAYINARWGGGSQYGYNTGWNPQTWFNADQAGGGIPLVDVIPEPDMGAHCSTRGLVYDPEKGKWIKRRRRRRRRLVTPTDIKDIAALKAIIGNGQALNSAVIKAVN